MADTARSFIALPLAGPAAAALLAGARAALAGQACERLRFYRADSLHLTLLFLDDVAVDRLPLLAAALDTRLAGLPAVEVAVSALQAFPASPGRIVAATLPPCPALLALQQAVKAAVVDCGLPLAGQPFRPHVTLARLRPALSLQWSLPATRLRFDRVGLYTSRLQPDGAVHHCEAQIRLAG
ncbi:MAG TPA: RNA 2',3'-cyclic phosphodiesterase [Pseudomonadales bacterium]